HPLLIEVDVPPIGTGGPDDLRHRLGQLPKLAFTSLQHFLGTLARRDVFELRDEVERRTVATPKNRNVEHDIDGRSVLADITLFAMVSGNFPTSQLTSGREIQVETVGMADGLERESGQLCSTVADNFAEHTIDTNETPIERDQRHTDGRFIDRESESLLRFMQRLFDAFALSDVAHERLPTAVRQNVRTCLNRDERSILPLLRPLRCVDPAWLKKIGPHRPQPVRVLRRNDVEDGLANQLVPFIAEEPARGFVNVRKATVQISLEECVG